MHYISGGVCAAKGFSANGIHCGVRKNKTKKDLALIFSDERAVAAGVYTTNLVKGAPLIVTKNNISDGYAQAMICNSGNANTCNENGIEMAEEMTECVAKELNIAKNDVIVASTGVIGQEFPIEPILEGIPSLVAGLGDKSSYAAHAILTTDTQKKEIAVKFKIGDKDCVLGGISKGSGMIHPNMATMLTFLTSDVNISSKMLQKALSDVVSDTFNMISVDGDTSTNDMVTIMANGMAENEII
ncbi:MAG: bifunctional ornithine acetyltransferase/N-acetylglutamate synthase, partial [Clostridia bacterium]|nr:bifunctional ornithine acetyltransferase/N-acetylglutamate synthase [Clostridia bacterium]